jgi:glyoxylase-like metal-dependent hydrolase (beta-lactamase superfamily II)
MSELPAHITFVERGVLHSNTIAVHADDRFLVFDTGYCTGAAALERALVERTGRAIDELALIVNTHAHPDHTGGNAHLQERTRCDIAMSDIDRMLIESGDPVTLMRDWADLHCPPFSVTRTLAPGDTLRFGPAEFRVVDGSGHAAGEVAFYSAADRVLVCGDLLWRTGFSNVVPLVEGVGGLARHERSLSALRALDVEIAIPGHGPIIAGASAVRRRIDETIDTIRYFRAHREKWARANIKSFLVMKVLAEGRIDRGAFVARCARSPWFREQAARFFSGATTLLDSLLDELLRRCVLQLEGGEIVCSLKA